MASECAVLGVPAIYVSPLGRGYTDDEEQRYGLVHNFTGARFHEDFVAAAEKLVEACKKYLVRHPGVIFFAAGTLCRELERPVNDRDFDVALHVIFKDKASHDAYQTAASHRQFIDENKASWKKVRVFDSLVDQAI